MLRNAKTMIDNGKRIDNTYNTLRFKKSKELRISRYCCKVISKDVIAPIKHAIAIAI